MTRPAQLLATGFLLAVAAGCQQKMAKQPYYRAFQPSVVLPKGTSAQPYPDGVMAVEWLRPSDPLMTGLKAGGSPDPAGEKGAAGQKGEAVPPPGVPSSPDKFVDVFPFPLTRADLDRGQERLTIFCAVCHDPLGTGNGKIPERGYVQPPSYITDDSRGFSLYRKKLPLREAPVGYLFEVVSRGYGAMPRYGPQIEPKDRWRVVAYVRALQVSRHADVAKLPPALQKGVLEKLGGGP